MKRKWYGQVNYSGFPYVDMRFDRDNSGLITSITSDSGDKGLSALYNNDLEIEQVQHTAPQVFDEGYSYDTRGNRLTSLINSFNYNDLNQLTNTNTHTYTYDADGNLIEEKNIATTETKKFYYSSENRMIKYEHYPTEIEPANIVAEYKYDIYSRRIQKNVNGNITNFFWEGDNMSFELNENHQPIRRYIYENGKDDVQGYVEYAEVDDPQYFSFERKGWYSYIKDQVGTITKVYKHETKQMVNARTYDTFGNLVNQTGSSNGNLGFQSKYFDQESELNYYYHRYYYPKVGRFINEDPIGMKAGMNMYKFANNNPVNEIDPLGLFTYNTPNNKKTGRLKGESLKLAQCIEKCMGESFVVTGGSEKTGHTKGSKHYTDQAFDMRKPGLKSEKMKILCCAVKCGAKFAHGGDHWHFQTVPGKKNSRGILPSKEKCKCILKKKK